MTPQTGMRRAEEFEQLRPLLLSIAHRILGSVSEAAGPSPSGCGGTVVRAGAGWRAEDR